jgi:hypothetical protein
MRKKLLAILFLLPLLFIGFLYSVSYVLVGNVIDEPDSIAFSDQTVFLAVGEEMTLTVNTCPQSEKFLTKITYTADREDIVKTDGDSLTGLKAGASDVIARYEDSNITDTLHVFVYTEESADCYVLDPDLSYSGIAEKKVYGEYDLSDTYERKPGTISLKAYDFGASVYVGSHRVPKAKAKSAAITKGNGTLAYDESAEQYTVEVLGSEDITVAFVSEAGKESDVTLPIIPDSDNVRTYAELLYCTNHSEEGIKAVLRGNLESVANTYSGKNQKRNTEPLALTEEEKESLSAYGKDAYFYVKRIHDGKEYYVEYLKRKSTYDTRYLERLGKPTDVLLGISLKKDFYGNGFTLNFHELTYPTGDPTSVSGVLLPSLSDSDVFRGPLDYCGVLATETTEAAASVAGEDNAVMGIEQDSLTLSGLILKNCSNVSALSQLDDVGTTLSVKHRKDVTVQDCVLSNGRNGVRAFSNDSFTLSHSLLEYAKDYLLRLGSDDYVALTEEEFLDGKDHNYPEGERIGNHARVENVFFYDSGFFSIGLENHFNGRYLYDKDEVFSNTLPLGGIAKGTDLELSAGCRFYDWKDIETVSTDTMLQVRSDLGNLSGYLSQFDIVPIIQRELAKDENQKFVRKDGDKTYLSTAIALYGGGINNSVLHFLSGRSETGLEEMGPVSFDPEQDKFLANCAGTEPFYFNLYPAASSVKNTDKPKLGDLVS